MSNSKRTYPQYSYPQPNNPSTVIGQGPEVTSNHPHSVGGVTAGMHQMGITPQGEVTQVQ